MGGSCGAAYSVDEMELCDVDCNSQRTRAPPVSVPDREIGSARSAPAQLMPVATKFRSRLSRPGSILRSARRFDRADVAM